MHISSVFFAIFDDSEGPRIVYQVPEDLITAAPRRGIDVIPTPTPTPAASDSLTRATSEASNLGVNNTGPAIQILPSSVPDLRALDGERNEKDGSLGKKNSSKSRLNASTSSRLNSSNNNNNKNTSVSPNRTPASTSSSKMLFEWDLVSQFVIPRPDICGRLTISTTKKHRIVGFPVIVRKARYVRGTFQFNVCFVFERSVDVRSYESVVRKLARVLNVCETDHQFLSSPQTKHKIYPILEQLFTDLNSFSETSIRIDRFNSLELRIFPRYPNPPPVNAWDVPVPLIDLGNKDKMEGNWDLTMRKVVPFINGVDHVKKIATKADADLRLVKECMAQVMMYQCVMMIDIFQFSNIYTLCRPVMWLFTDPAIYEECGPYVHKSNNRGGENENGKEDEPIPWPRLAWYYARLKPPLTVGKWISQYEIDLEKIDVRRFISFGVIKGFLRRVHRWPILLKNDTNQSNPPRRRNKSMHWTHPRMDHDLEIQSSNMSPPSDLPPGLGSSAGLRDLSDSGDSTRPLLMEHVSLLREDTLKPLEGGGVGGISRLAGQRILEKERVVGRHAPMGGISASIPASLVSPSVLKSRMNVGGGIGAGISSLDSSAQEADEEDARALSLPIPQELADQAHTQGQVVLNLKMKTGFRNGIGGGVGGVDIPPDLTELLDGTHHSDELCVHLGLSWNVLLATLSVIGGGTGNDEDLGRVAILYR